MRTKFTWWLIKECREQRYLLLGIVASLALLNVVGVLCFGRALQGAQEAILGSCLCLLLFSLAVVSDVFGRDVKAERLDFVRRLPGSTLASFIAKFLFIVIGYVFIYWIQASLLALTWWVSGQGSHANVVLNDTWRIFTHPMSSLIAASVLAWCALLATWLPKGGMSSLAALVSMVLLSAPPIWFVSKRPDIFNQEWAIVWLARMLLATALIALAVSYLRGTRFGNRRLGPFAAGLPVVIITLAGITTLTAGTVRTWFVLSPTSPGVEIQSAYLAEGERYLYVQAFREPQGMTAMWRHEQAIRAWRFDLALETWEPLADDFGYLDDTSWSYFPYLGVRPLLRHIPTDSDEHLVEWILPSTGEIAAVLEYSQTPVKLEPILRKHFLDRSRARDENGVRIALWKDKIIREDLSDLELTIAEAPEPDVRTSNAEPLAIAGGWFQYAHDQSAHETLHRITDYQGNTQLRRIPKDARPLSIEEYLYSEGGSYRVGRYDGEPSRQVPMPAPHPNKIVGIFSKDNLLIVDDKGGLSTWSPDAGTQTPIRWLGNELERIKGPSRRIHPIGDGRILVEIFRKLERGKAHSQYAWVIFDPTNRTAKAIHGWEEASNSLCVAFTSDESLILIENQNEIVRYSEDGTREVLFSRTEDF